MSSPRQASISCLIETDKGSYSNLALKNSPAIAALAPRDLAFATVLFYGTLERTITLDYILDQSLKQPIAKLDSEVRAILRSGLYQCLYMDSVPVSAAVNESVKLCKLFKKTSASSLVNAVLRKASCFDLASIEDIADKAKKQSVKFSLCPELVEMLNVQYKNDAEEIMQAMFGRSSVAVRVNTLKIEISALEKQLLTQDIETQRDYRVENALVIKNGEYLRSKALAEGLMRIQSLAAQSAALALDAQPGMRVLDMCAAPGGKTLTIAQEMKNRGSIVALDCYESRIKLINKQASIEGVNIIETKLADAATYKSEETFDRVLCDVPCSGYGEISSKPELRLKAPQSSNSLFVLQQAILQNGSSLLCVNGCLVYSTCTLDQRENEDAVTAFLKNNPNFRLKQSDLVKDIAVANHKYEKITPNRDNSEGFFIATFERMC